MLKVVQGGQIMKKLVLFFTVVLCVVLPLVAQATSEQVLTVYAYDSFTGDWGAGNDIVKAFEEQTGIKVNLIGVGGAVEMYSKIVYEGKDCPADVVIGISDSINVDQNLFLDWTPSCIDDLSVPKDGNLLPFDYGFFAFIADMDYFKTHEVPQCLEDLTKPEFKGKVILIDPRTSSVGLGLFAWTIQTLGEDGAFSWWKSMKDNALTIGDSWSTSYGLFTEGEAPLVISYTTSPVYHALYEDTDRYQALDFTNGHIKTTEYLGILKSSKNVEKAKQFCEFVLTQGQEKIAIANTMFPANSSVELPDAFSIALKPSKVVEYDTHEFVAKTDAYLTQWAQTMVL